MADRGTLTLGLAAILIASMLAGAGSLAYFSDTVTSTGNTFTAGTFILKDDGESLPLKVGNIMPGWSEWQTHGVKNIGSLAGEVYITAEHFAEPPEGRWGEPPEPESTDVSATDFAKILYMRIYADVDQDYYYEEDEIIYDGPVYGMVTDRFSINSDEYISCKFVAYLPTDLDGDDNLYQADGVAFDIVFHGTTEITI